MAHSYYSILLINTTSSHGNAAVKNVVYKVPQECILGRVDFEIVCRVGVGASVIVNRFIDIYGVHAWMLARLIVSKWKACGKELF